MQINISIDDYVLLVNLLDSTIEFTVLDKKEKAKWVTLKDRIKKGARESNGNEVVVVNQALQYPPGVRSKNKLSFRKLGQETTKKH